MVLRVFIIHGWGGHPDSNWFPWLKSKLEERGIETKIVEMPDSDNPKQDPWVSTLENEVGISDKDTYFIGHSLGCITILRYLEELTEGERAGGVVLVAGFTDSLGIDELSDFFTEEINWSIIKPHCSKFVAIASDNDHYVDLKYGTILKEKLDAKLLIQPQMGHFNMKELHVALNELLKIMT